MSTGDSSKNAGAPRMNLFPDLPPARYSRIYPSSVTPLFGFSATIDILQVRWTIVGHDRHARHCPSAPTLVWSHGLPFQRFDRLGWYQDRGQAWRTGQMFAGISVWNVFSPRCSTTSCVFVLPAMFSTLIVTDGRAVSLSTVLFWYLCM